ncbi:MAG: site-specific integrase, partial [Bacillota bacterium]
NQTLLGLRDKAIILTLLDTGVRAQELLQMDITDLNLITGEILVKQGKGRKPRTVFIGSKTKRTLRNYLNKRNDPIPALWITNSNYHKLTYSGLVWVIKRRSKTAGVDNIPLHSFRRQFALSMLRRGVDILTISRIMGHTSLAVINRYVKQLNSDLQNGHIKGSPVDHENF